MKNALRFNAIIMSAKEDARMTTKLKKDSLQRGEKEARVETLAKQAQHSPGISNEGEGCLVGRPSGYRGTLVLTPGYKEDGGETEEGYTGDIAQQCTATCTRFVTRL